MIRWLLRSIAIAVLAAACWPATAYAQIYSWRDANGTLVLSDQRPAGGEVRSFPVPGTKAVRSTRTAAQSASRLMDAIIERNARTHDLRPELVRAVIQTESAFNPLALSSKGAMGLMQLMPGTAEEYGVKDPYNPEENVRGGTAYLKDLLERYQGSEELALAAYNAGPGAVDRFGQTVPPFQETRDYLARVRRATSVSTVSPSHIYKTTVIVNGREVVKYTNVRPGPDASEILAARRR
jgi:soluble lytic murein transglycosylase-like protein